jgi:hypothetical protein
MGGGEIKGECVVLDIMRCVLKDVEKLKELLQKKWISGTYQRRSVAAFSALAAQHSLSHQHSPLLHWRLMQLLM